MTRSAASIIGLLALAFFGCFLLWPVGQTLRGAFFDADGAFTLAYVAEVFRNRVYLEGFRNSFLLAAASTGAAFCLALPLAFLADRFEFPGKALLGALVLVPLILPPFVGAIGVRQILGQYGALNALLQAVGWLPEGATIDWLGHGRFWGIVAMNALHLYPILYLNLAAALANVDPAMGEAAENLGCTGLRKHWRITLPLIMPGIFAGGTIVFIWAFTELGVPLIFDYPRVTSVQIFSGIRDLGGNPFPFALVAVMLVVSAALYGGSKLLFGGGGVAMMAKATGHGGARRAGPAAAVACPLAFAFVGLVAMLPHLGVIAVSVAGDWYGSIWPERFTLGHYAAALGHEFAVPSIANSLKYAGLSTAVDLALGVAIAAVVVRSRLPGRHLLDALSMVPLAVPGMVLAFGYVSMTQEGRVFAFLNPAKDPTALLVIAYAVRRLPYIVRSAVAGLEQTSATLEEAAANLGAPPFRVLRRITLPLISANLLAGGLLAFAFAMLEVADSLILAQRQQDFPITKAIYELFGLLGEGRFMAAAMGVWAMAFLGVTLFAASRAMGRKLGALFRV